MLWKRRRRYSILQIHRGKRGAEEKRLKETERVEREEEKEMGRGDSDRERADSRDSSRGESIDPGQ